MDPSFPAPLRATLDDLPAPAAAALRAAAAGSPDPGDGGTIQAGGVDWSVRAWGPSGGRPLLLLHGVASSSRAWWRIGPALGALGWRVVAPDLPGHGGSSRYAGRGRFEKTAEEVVALAASAFGSSAFDETESGSSGFGSSAPPDLAVVGHSWGAMIAAELPRAGLRPERIVLLDPPQMDRTACQAMVDDPSSRPSPAFEVNLAALQAENPDWHPGEWAAKAEALTQADLPAIVGVLLKNTWDAGLVALADPAAAGIPTWIVRGEEPAGSLTPDALLAAFAALPGVGAGRILTVAEAGHSPQRTRIEATVLALLRALEG
jgi:pimeloyl-ACP methyl ester carboxylesterase